MIEAICRLDAVEAVEHGFDWDKSEMYRIERSVWRLIEPGRIVAGPGRALCDAPVCDVGSCWMDG